MIMSIDMKYHSFTKHKRFYLKTLSKDFSTKARLS